MKWVQTGQSVWAFFAFVKDDVKEENFPFRINEICYNNLSNRFQKDAYINNKLLGGIR